MMRRRVKLQKDPQGFTLVELMIVVAIIGILAAIAIPQFAAYRIRTYNASAKVIAGNAKASEANLNAELGAFGHTNAAGWTLADDDSALFGVADSGAVPALAIAATEGTAGSRLTGTNQVSVKSFSVPLDLGARMVADIQNSAFAAASCPGSGCSYVIHTRATYGDTAYAMDSDMENGLYSVSNPAWLTAGNGLQATGVVGPTDGVNDIALVADGGGAPTPGWARAF